MDSGAARRGRSIIRHKTLAHNRNQSKSICPNQAKTPEFDILPLRPLSAHGVACAADGADGVFAACGA